MGDSIILTVTHLGNGYLAECRYPEAFGLGDSVTDAIEKVRTCIEQVYSVAAVGELPRFMVVKHLEGTQAAVSLQPFSSRSGDARR